MKNNKRVSFGYEDTDSKIEVDFYGIVFEINNLDSIDDFKSLDRNDESVIEAQIEKILGKGAIEKINRKRVSDGYKELDLNIELNMLGCIFEAYAKGTAGNILGRVTNAVEDINKDMNNTINREQRRNYNRTNQYNNYNKNRNRRRY
jgi:hypothetical protein